MNRKTIIIYENESIDSVLNKLRDIDKEKFKNEWNFIFKKIYNNQAGYFVFYNEDFYYKIFILPKIISESLTDNEKIKIFIDYLILYYKLSSKYDIDFVYKEDLLKEIAEIFSKNENNILGQKKELENFLFYKYEAILMSIYKFFKRHKSLKKEIVSYYSQTVRHKINLIKNIREIDKTKIHQDKTIINNFSEIANITIGALKLFKRYKIKLIDDKEAKQELLKNVKKIENLLIRKFHAKDSFKLNMYSLVSIRTLKRFRKYKSLYFDLLSLFNMENFFEETERKLNYNYKSDYVFINTSKLYEWFVYDKFLNLFDRDKIFKEGKHKESIKKYYIFCGNDTITVNSKPDLLINNINKLFVIDVKWKVLSYFKDFDLDDLLKLKRDVEVRNCKDKNIIPVLIYPKIINEKVKYIKMIEKICDKKFDFYILEMSLFEDNIELFNGFFND